MDIVTSALTKFKRFAQDLVDGFESSSSRNSIEILKRLQRESFSDLMKLRERQDKVERLIKFYQASKGNPFEESNTRLRGEVNLLGAVLLMSKVDEERWDGVGRGGIGTGVDSRFRFETTVRDKDSVGVEFVADNKRGATNDGDVYGSPLSLSKLFYKAKAGNWFSAVAIPFGAQFRDFDVDSDFGIQEDKGLTDLSIGPPLLHQHKGGGIGVTVRNSNIIASLAQSVCEMRNEHCFSTFGQVVCQLPTGLKLSILGHHQWPKLTNHSICIGPLAIPVGFSRHIEDCGTKSEGSSLHSTTNTLKTGSIALKLESEDEYKRLAGWVEMSQARPKHLQWAVTLSDISEDAFGWGMSLGGIVEGPRNWDHLQVESYLKFDLGKRFSLKPGVAYVVDWNSRSITLVLRSNWSL